jgi:bifunctional polynucleotide phosphatase/kinase
MQYPSSIAHFGPEPKFSKLIMFDLDGTLIKTKSKREMPIDVDDWEWWIPDIPKRLKELQGKGYHIIIITNQANVARADQKFRLTRVENVWKSLHSQIKDIECYAALEKDEYRKPNTTLFEQYILPRFTAEPVNIPYIGDAAGRKGDFADTDRKFAYNLSLLLKALPQFKKTKVKFITPEEFFLKEEPRPRNWRGFDPEAFLKQVQPPDTKWLDELPAQQHAIVLIGPAATGKSTLAQQICERTTKRQYPYVIINQDACKTKIKCLKVMHEALEAGKSVIIDSTNPDTVSRLIYVRDLHETYPRIQVWYVWIDNPIDLIQHLNQYRGRYGFARIPSVAYRVYDKKFTPPSLDEGAKRLIKYHFYPEFKSFKDKLLFLQRSE